MSKEQNLEDKNKALHTAGIKQIFIDLVEERINDLKREMNYTKQGQEFYDDLQERIDELTDLLSDMRNVV